MSTGQPISVSSQTDVTWHPSAAEDPRHVTTIRRVEWLALRCTYSHSLCSGQIILTDMYRGLTQSFGANSRIVPQIGPQKLHFTSFAIYFLLIILSFDTIQPTPLTNNVKRTVN